MNLSEHFTENELLYSDTANARGIKNIPNEIQKKVLIHTCQYFLEPLRRLFNESYKTYNNKKVDKVFIKITSGFRCLALNRALGSSDTSQHIKGEAVDFEVRLRLEDDTVIRLPYNETYNFIKNLVKNKKITVDQLICERSGNATWVHASYKAAGSTVNRNQFLIYKNGCYVNDK